MGWFGSLCSSVGNFISSAASAIKSTVNFVTETAAKAARFAGEVLTKVAEVGEKVIKTVKATWNTVIKPVLKGIQFVAKVAAVIVPHPAIKAIAVAIDRGIGVVLAIEKSPLLRTLDKTLTKVLGYAKNIGKVLLTTAEILEAKREQKKFEEAEKELTGEAQQAVLLAKIINQFTILKSEVTLKIENDEVENMEQYLQLRASQKIMECMELKFNSGCTLDDITDDDLFILDISSRLIEKNPNISEEETLRFQDIVRQIFNKDLLPFVFEEMIKMWAADLNKEFESYETLKKDVSRKEVILKRHERSLADNDEMTAEEIQEMKDLRIIVPKLQAEMAKAFEMIMRREYYIDASEGMLRALENDLVGGIEKALPGMTKEEMAEIMQEQIPDLSKTIIDCMERGKSWDELDIQDKQLIKNFALVFRKASQRRGCELVAVEVAA